jgi:hypothetical protein
MDPLLLELEKWMKDNDISRNLLTAIETMRDACYEAERQATEGDERAIRQVLHQLSWGFANASSYIEAAMSVIERNGRKR